MSSVSGTEMREIDLSPQQRGPIYKHTGELLKKIHEIKLKGFGTLQASGKELDGEFLSWKNFWESREDYNNKGIDFLLVNKLINPEEAKKIRAVYKEIASLDFGEAS